MGRTVEHIAGHCRAKCGGTCFAGWRAAKQVAQTVVMRLETFERVTTGWKYGEREAAGAVGALAPGADWAGESSADRQGE